MIAMVKNSENLENLRRVSSLTHWGYMVNENGTACVSLEGSTQYSMDYGWYLTNSAYLNLRAVLEECATNPDVKRVALSISSPGGEAIGLIETAGYIHSLLSKKPIYAFTDSLACSAAYLLGASCKAFYSSRYAEVGCCGVMASVTDYSEYEKKWASFQRFSEARTRRKRTFHLFQKKERKNCSQR